MTGTADEMRLKSELMQLITPAQITKIESRDWCSATFQGRQLRYDILWQGRAGQAGVSRLASLLPDHPFPLERHFIADIIVENISDLDAETTAEISILMIAD
ncbi:hypothetical protein ACFOWX_12265 [Sphingorhabdus arenilitoris]|uniref:Uncharacterized protein n=1 Tax=Sphingorhabdus arenilitoris TaxID=1490041 RepID=A0ABV8RIW7_9SPHN